MNPEHSMGRARQAPFGGSFSIPCALRVVVYRDPGPDGHAIAQRAREVAARYSGGRSGGAVGYVTLLASDFDRLRKGIEYGDLLATAYGVLNLLGPRARQFIGRENDFCFGWIGATDGIWGDVLLLEVLPQPHLPEEGN